jgi:hypothetical protein
VEEFSPSSLNLKEGLPEMNAKGADIKVLIFWLAGIAREFQKLSPRCDRAKVLDLAAYSLASWVKVLDDEGLWMRRSAACKAAHHGLTYVKTFLWLSHDAYINNKLWFKLRPKLHLFHHWSIGQTSLVNIPLNPKAYSCWSDEDFVRRVCSVASGVGHVGIVTSMISRY